MKIIAMNRQTNPEAPEWMKPAGWIAVIVGALGFIASASVAGGGSLEGAIVAGVLNPLFFIGVPLGVYWLHCSYLFDGLSLYALRQKSRAHKPSPPPQESTSKPKAHHETPAPSPPPQPTISEPKVVHDKATQSSPIPVSASKPKVSQENLTPSSPPQPGTSKSKVSPDKATPSTPIQVSSSKPNILASGLLGFFLGVAITVLITSSSTNNDDASKVISDQPSPETVTDQPPVVRYWREGTHKVTVEIIEGTPKSLTKYSNEEVWGYNSSDTVTFDLQTGRVIAWHNYSGNLHAGR